MTRFHRSMRRFHRRWSVGRLVFSMLVLAIIFSLGLLAHGWADYEFALAPTIRVSLNIILTAAIVLLGLIWFYRIVRTPHERLAAMLDNQRADPRHQMTGAANLESVEPKTSMQKFHLDRALDEAALNLDKLPGRNRMPFRAIGIASCGVLLVAGLVAALLFGAAEPFRVTAARILNPHADIPPYSPLKFEVTPGDSEALYGGEALVQVAVTGGEITEDVHCLIRNRATGEVERTTAYQESPGHYARKFSNALTSVDFAFATGRARSAWHKLDVLLQPKVSGVTVTVVPPAYTGRSSETFPLESGEVEALEGSTVTLSVQSNRPLSGGLLAAKPLNSAGDGVPVEVRGDPSGANLVDFSWTVHASARISATIRDVRSTPSEQPLELNLKVIADQAPVLDLTSPEQMVLATPRTELPFVAEVEDDHGLAKVSMVRALLGFRDRSRTLADALVRQDFEFTERLNLGELGVEVGQILEFYLEAMDRNPSLLGRGVSEMVRVKIISEEDYAERIRARVVLREFTARYRALAHAVQEARNALDALDKAADLGGNAAFEEARKRAEAAHAEAEELAGKLERDFQAFAMEKRLSDLAAEAAQNLGKNRAGLAQLDPAAGETATRRAIDEMRERLGGAQEQADQLELDAELVVKVGRVMEMAAEFKRIHLAQQSLAQRLGTIADEVARGNVTNTALLDNLGQQQANNREALIELATELKARADALPPGFEQMQQDVAGFLETLRQLDIPDPMQAAAEAAAKGISVDASSNALLALSLLEKLINQPDNGF